MSKWKPLNMKLRSHVISQVLRLEQTSSDALKAILRMFKSDSRTFGNKSSALSFKSKIDLLVDLEEITPEETIHFQKLMEIRNQFAHNPNANSFSAFQTINSEVYKHLLKNCPEKFKEDAKIEAKLKGAFDELFMQMTGKLLSIEIEYKNGIRTEMNKHFNDLVVENIDDIWSKAVQKNHEKIILPIYCNNVDETANMLNEMKLSISEFKLNEMNKIEGKETSILKQKEALNRNE